MHHFKINADRETGLWHLDTIQYLGTIDSAAHYARKDTDAEHYDDHDGEALSTKFWDVACVEPTTKNVALTVVWE